MRKELGKIRSVSFGFGGYQDCQFGLSLGFESGGGVVGTFEGNGPLTMDIPEEAEWTEADRERTVIATIKLLTETLQKAHVKSVSELLGVPVELTYNGQCLREWRILEEVI